MRLDNWFKQKGYNLSAYNEMIGYIQVWKQWHAGHVPSFHDYTMNNGKSKVRRTKYTLNMANQVCKDYADLLLNEKVQYNIGNEELTQVITDKVLDPNNFPELSNSGQELTMALGTGALVKRLVNLEYNKVTGVVLNSKDTEFEIDFVTADKIIPLRYNGKKVIDCAFVTTTVDNGFNITCVAIHRHEESGYVIENYYFTEDNYGNMKRYNMEGTLEVFYTGTHMAWFNIMRPNIANTINLDSPYGISVFHSAIPQLMGIDNIYDSFVNEFVLGKKRIFIDPSLMKVDTVTGEPYFDDGDITFYQLQGVGSAYGDGSSEPNKMMVESNMTIRSGEHTDSLNMAFNMLSNAVGLGDGFYTVEGGSVMTATQVVSDNSALYRSIKKHEISLENALHDFFKSILEIGEKYKIEGVSTMVRLEDEEGKEGELQLADVSIDFDDSIIEDTETIIKRARMEADGGYISKIQYYMDTKKMTRKQATEFYELQQKEMGLSDDVEMEEDI